MSFFKMFGHVAKGAVNPVSQQVTARSASQIIEIVTGKPCSPGQFERLASAAELAIEFNQSDTKHDYAFQLLHRDFINEMFKDYWESKSNNEHCKAYDTCSRCCHFPCLPQLNEMRC